MNIIKVIILLFLFLSISCKKEVPPLCITDNCYTNIVLNYPKDNSGYYHIKIINEYDRIPIYAEASDMNEFWKYNGMANIDAHFCTNTYWLIDTIVAKVPYFNPFTSIYTSPYFNTPIKIGDTTVILSQFRNTMVPIITENGTRFMEYYPGDRYRPASEYKPKQGYLWTKQFIGPLLLGMKGDTSTIYMDVGFDGEFHSYSYVNIIFE